jgi:hypothetical protein
MVDKRIINNGKTDDSAYFNEADEIRKRNSFTRREVGLTHPDTSSFIRLSDRGDIEIFAGEELGIVISPSSGSISIFADVVKIFTKEDNGLRWNNMSLNYASDEYSEPALVKTSEKEINSGFNYADYYLNLIDNFDPVETGSSMVTIDGEFAFRGPRDSTREEAPFQNSPSSISDDSLTLLKEYSLTNTQEKVDYMKNLLELGFTFSQARDKTLRDKGA